MVNTDQRNKFLTDSAVTAFPTSGLTENNQSIAARRRSSDLKSFLFTTAAVVTVPFKYFVPGDDAMRSFSVSAPIVWEVRQKRGRRISLREAHTLALTIGTVIEREIESYKKKEASFWNWIYDHET